MRNNDKLKLKIKRILDKELTDEELLMVGSITIAKSAEDKRKEELYRDEVNKATQEELQVRRLENEVRAKEGINALAMYVGKVSLPYNSFTAGVSEFLAKKGKITTSQREAIMNTYDD